MTITALEQVISSAERRAILNNEQKTSVRIADIFHMVPALTGKLELVYEGEQEGAVKVAKHIIGKAINKTFKNHFPDPQSKSDTEKAIYKAITDWFASGNEINLPDTLPSKEYETLLNSIPKLKDLVINSDKGAIEADAYAIMDLALEALHQNSMLSKQDLDDQNLYSDMLGSMFSSLGGIEDDFENFDS